MAREHLKGGRQEAARRLLDGERNGCVCSQNGGGDEATCDQLVDALAALAACRAKGNAAYAKGSWLEACDEYTKGLEMSACALFDISSRATLLCNRSAARRYARDLDGAVADATDALDCSPLYRKAAWRRGVALLEAGEPLAAHAAFLHLMRLDNSWPGLLGWLQRCKHRLNASRGEKGKKPPPDHYATLGVPCDCSQEAIRKAYKRQSLKVHPDRQRGGGSGVSEEEASARFQQLQVAFECLSEPSRRSLYDFGDDGDWETACKVRYYPPAKFKPFVKPRRERDLFEPEC